MVDHLEQTILEVQKLSQSRVNEFMVSFNMSNSKFENVGQHHWVINLKRCLMIFINLHEPLTPNSKIILIIKPKEKIITLRFSKSYHC